MSPTSYRTAPPRDKEKLIVSRALTPALGRDRFPSGAGLAPHLDSASPRGACNRGKGVHTSGRTTWVLHGRATNRRGLGDVWPEKDPTMTRARALKQLIRARAARTGERYTAARRHVLKDLQTRTTSSVVTMPPPPAPRAAVSSKGSVSDAKSREKTGRGLDHWFEVLDRFGGVEKGHTAAARHLYDTHGVDGWYAQGITVAYERGRGVRTVNQRRDGQYEVSVSKVLPAGTADVVKAIADPRRRRRWTGSVDAELAGAVAAAFGRGSKGFVVKPNNEARCRFPWRATTVQFYITPKPGGKSSLVAVNAKLGRAEMVDERRGLWRTALNALAASFAP